MGKKSQPEVEFYEFERTGVKTAPNGAQVPYRPGDVLVTDLETGEWWIFSADAFAKFWSVSE